MEPHVIYCLFSVINKLFSLLWLIFAKTWIGVLGIVKKTYCALNMISPHILLFYTIASHNFSPLLKTKKFEISCKHFLVLWPRAKATFLVISLFSKFSRGINFTVSGEFANHLRAFSIIRQSCACTATLAGWILLSSALSTAPWSN